MLRVAGLSSALLLALATFSMLAAGGNASPEPTRVARSSQPGSATPAPSQAGTTPVRSVVVSRPTPGRTVVVSPTPRRSPAGTVTPLPEVPAPKMHPHPTARTESTISVRFDRAPAPDLVCKPYIGYEMAGGGFRGWRDVGGFPHAPCDDPDPGYKFSGLNAGTTYTLRIRAYRVVAGVKHYSLVSSVTASTLG